MSRGGRAIYGEWVKPLLVSSLLTSGLVACAGGPPVAATWVLEAPGTAPPGVIAGRVFAWRDIGFEPLAGAGVLVDGAPSDARTDARGAFLCTGVVEGAHLLAASAGGFVGVSVAVYPSAAAGVLGVSLVASPAGGDDGGGDRRVVGVITDPWGAALAGGTVHCVDSASLHGAGGNRRWEANADGLFTGLLTDVGDGGAASFMAYGRLADGRAAEGRFLQTVALGHAGIVGVAVATHAVAAGEGAVKPP